MTPCPFSSSVPSDLQDGHSTYLTCYTVTVYLPTPQHCHLTIGHQFHNEMLHTLWHCQQQKRFMLYGSARSYIFQFVLVSSLLTTSLSVCHCVSLCQSYAFLPHCTSLGVPACTPTYLLTSTRFVCLELFP